MKVDLHLNSKQTTFADIEAGECFLCSGCLYIKLNIELEVLISGAFTSYSEKYNAVKLLDGEPYPFQSSTSVRPYDAKVTSK